MTERGAPRKIRGEHQRALVEFVEANPSATLKEIQEALARQTGVQTHGRTIAAALREAGLEYRRGVAGIKVAATERADSRPGHAATHRGSEPEQTYPSSLTDEEWILIEDLFDQTGERGFPPKYPRRLMVDACCYVARTGCSWRALPKEFPKWQNVYRTFRRWIEQGKFEHMYERLHGIWREWEDRAQEPTAVGNTDRSTRQ